MPPAFTSVALLVVAYLIGSLSGSLLLGRLRGVDIRTHGSGNAGGTNALRTQGWKFALGTVLIDVGKGALAVWLALRFGGDFGGSGSGGDGVDGGGSGGGAWLPYAAGFAAMLGHVWPVFHGFRGGKGAGTLVGALLVAWPLALAALIATWAAVLVATGYVGLATIVAALVLPAVALFIVFTHRANVARLRAGAEHRFDGARVWTRLRRRSA